MSACLQDINPFDQPDAEANKRKLLEWLREEKEAK